MRRLPSLGLITTICALPLFGCIEARSTTLDMQEEPTLKADCQNGFFETNEYGPIQWPKDSQLQFKLHSKFPAPYIEALQHSAKKYEEVISSPTLTVDDSVSDLTFEGMTASSSGDGINAVYWVSDHFWPWKKSHPDAIAMTLTNYSNSGKLIEADIYFRATAYGDFSLEPKEEIEIETAKQTLPSTTSQNGLAKLRKNQIIQAFYNPNSDSIDMMEHFIYMVGLHEFGHTLGRCHSDDEDSIMFKETTLGPASSRSKPFSKLDFEIFGKVYTALPFLEKVLESE